MRLNGIIAHNFEARVDVLKDMLLLRDKSWSIFIHDVVCTELFSLIALHFISFFLLYASVPGIIINNIIIIIIQ